MADKASTPDQAQFNAVLNAVLDGVRISDIIGMNHDYLEGLYSLGYNLYTASNYKDAETVFKALCLYDHMDVRFWMGLGGCRQALGNYKEAIDAYSMAGMTSTLADPEPFLFAARCYLELGDRENALGALKGLMTLGEKGNAAHEACHAKAAALIEILEKKA